MEITVRNLGYNNYRELTLKEQNVNIETGTLNGDEAREMAVTFVRAAYALLPDSVLRDKLIEIEEGL